MCNQMVSRISGEYNEINIHNRDRTYAEGEEFTLNFCSKTTGKITTFASQRDGVQLGSFDSPSGSSIIINNSEITENTRVSNLQENIVSEKPSESFTVHEEYSNAPTQSIISVTEDDIQVVLKQFRVKNMGGLLFGHLNVNSIRNKFEAIKLLFEGIFDIIIISETKLDNTFLAEQFYIDGYNIPVRLDKK